MGVGARKRGGREEKGENEEHSKQTHTTSALHPSGAYFPTIPPMPSIVQAMANLDNTYLWSCDIFSQRYVLPQSPLY